MVDEHYRVVDAVVAYDDVLDIGYLFFLAGPECEGRGVLRREEEIKLEVPAGIDNGEMMRLSGQGEAVKGGASGDLYVKIHVKPHPVFRKEGLNLVMALPLKLTDALLGTTVSITTLEDKILEVKVPPMILSSFTAISPIGTGRGVTEPISTKPKPSRSSASGTSALLSKPAAMPIGLGKFRPKARTASLWSSARVLTGGSSRRPWIAMRCASSGSNQRSSGSEKASKARITVAVRTLGAEYQKVMPLAEAIAMLKGEATPPDLR